MLTTSNVPVNRAYTDHADSFRPSLQHSSTIQDAQLISDQIHPKLITHKSLHWFYYSLHVLINH